MTDPTGILWAMAAFNEGQKVRVVTREVTQEDRKSNRYFAHMAGLTGTVQNYYGTDEVAVRIDPESLDPIARSVMKEAIIRMRKRFLDNVSEEQRSKLSPEEQEFTANYNLLVRSADLEKI